MQLTALLTAFLLSLLQLWPSANFISAPSRYGEITIDSYAGTWVGHTASSEFKIVLEEHKNYRIPNGRNYDVITGRHSYSVKGAIIDNESLSKPADKFTLVGIFQYEHPEQQSMTFSDEVNHKIVHVNLSFLGNDKSKLLWAITEETETVNTNPATKVLPGVSAPFSLILKKVR